MIRFRILGAGGALPTPTHNPAAYWVRVDQTDILMDPGPGALVRLVQSGDAQGVDDIELVLLTHLHPDHCADLLALLFALHSPLTASTKPLRIYGPVGLATYLNKLADLYGSWIQPRQRELIVKEWAAPESLELPDGGLITPFAADHPQDRFSAGGCLGYKFTDHHGHTAVFSGDSGPCAGLAEAAAGADLLVVECSAPAGLGIEGHMDSIAVGKLCAVAQPGQVVLTHQYPAAAAADLCAEIAPYFAGPVAQAQDGHLIVIPSTHGANCA